MNFYIPDYWAALTSQYSELVTGRITLQEKGMYRIFTSTGEQNALVSGKFQFDAQSVSDYPAVGDYVLVSRADPDTAIIHHVLPRKSLFLRKAAGTSQTEQVVAANIDTVFLCMSLNNDFNLRRLERYLAAAWESKADPVVLLTKADLCEDVVRKQAGAESIAMGVTVLTASAADADGYQQLMPYITVGKTVAFEGSSGVGKSTLCSLIPRFYDVSGGRILIDGRDIRDFTVKSLRNNIGIVQQDVYLFTGSVMDNIRYGRPDATEAEIVAAAQNANAHEFIMNLPEGYDTNIGQRGIKLSGGQKQRLSIARVFLKNPPILIFDEATSALDNESERVVQESLEKLAKGRTTFVIAHRLSTIRNAQKILVLTENGIAESGTHQELLEKNGIYAELYNMQFQMK